MTITPEQLETIGPLWARLKELESARMLLARAGHLAVTVVDGTEAQGTAQAPPSFTMGGTPQELAGVAGAVAAALEAQAAAVREELALLGVKPSVERAAHDASDVVAAALVTTAPRKSAKPAGRKR